MRTHCRFALAFTMAVMTAGVAHAQATLKMNISVAQNSHYGVAIDTFAREVEKRSNGRYTVQNFYAGALGAERESIEGVQLGTLDLTMTSTGPVPNFVPCPRCGEPKRTHRMCAGCGYYRDRLVIAPKEEEQA